MDHKGDRRNPPKRPSQNRNNNARHAPARQTQHRAPQQRPRRPVDRNGRPLTDAEIRERSRRRRLAQQRRRKQRMRRRIFAAIAVACLCILLVLGVWLVSMYKEEREEAQVQQQIRDAFAQASAEAQAADVPEKDATGSEAEPTQEARTQPFISDALAELANRNADLIGWITVGQEISTPVVLRDNDYYMDHDFYQNPSNSGTVFADERNTDWQNDQYLVLYGHNMRLGTMFGKLDEYDSMDYLKTNAQVEFKMLYNNEVRQYVPFAVVDASMNKSHSSYFPLRNFSIFDEETYDEQAITEYMAQMVNRSMYSIPGVEVAPDDNILCLVTCSYDLPNARFMVFCREVREGENAGDLIFAIQNNAVKK